MVTRLREAPYVLATLAFLTYATETMAEGLPPGITCEMVREAIRTLPKETLEQYKKSATPEQLKAARKCLRS